MDKRQYDVDVAMDVGMIPAILLDSIRRWIEHNENNDKHFYDGETWTYNSLDAWQKGFPELTYKQVRRGLDVLRDNDYLKVGNYNKFSSDRTLWYALTQKARLALYGERMHPFALEGKCIERKGQMSFAPQGRPIPSIKPSTKQHIFTPPTLDEVVAYAKSRNSSVDPKFFHEYFSTAEWIDSTGKPVKNWKQKFLTWERGNFAKPNAPKVVNNTPSVDLGGYNIEETMANSSCLLDDLIGESNGK